MNYQFVLVGNVLLLHSAMEALSQRSHGVPGIGLIQGPAGTGKSTALAAMVARKNAVFVRAYSKITQSGLLDMLCAELQVSPRRDRNGDKYRLVCQALRDCPRPIFVDEANYFRHDIGTLEILRDIGDTEDVPVLLVGMENIERQLSHHQQILRRISQRVEFGPCDLKDARLVANTLCEVEIEEDLLQLMHKQTLGRIGNMVVALSKFEATAKGNRWKSIGSAQWGSRSMFVGTKQQKVS